MPADPASDALGRAFALSRAGRTEEALALVDALLARAPGEARGHALRARVLAQRGETAAARDAVARALAIDPGCAPALVEHAALARAAGDVNLDSIGWSGGNTTLEILWFGTPTVTVPGRTMRIRHTAAMLRLLELPQLIARDADHYVDLAVELGRSPDFRAEMRGLVEARKHRLYDDRAVAAALEAFCLAPPGAAA